MWCGSSCIWCGPGEPLHKKMSILIIIQIWNLKSSVSDPDPDWRQIQSGQWNGFPDSESGSGSRRAKITHKNWKKFWSAGCSLLRADGFSWSLEVLYGGLGISKMQYLIQKISIFFSCKFVPILGHKNPGFGLDLDGYSLISLKCWLDPDPDSMNPDPKHWIKKDNSGLHGAVKEQKCGISRLESPYRMTCPA